MLPRWIRKLLRQQPPFEGTTAYWEERYRAGGTSGPGSAGELAAFKAEVLNSIVRDEGIASVIEFGCGDGQQLALYDFPDYLGLDVSPSVIDACRTRFADDPTKRFALMTDYAGEQADLALSIDVLFHLVEQDLYESYLRQVFAAAERLVVLYTSDFDAPPDPNTPHIRRRATTLWVAEHGPDWRLRERIPNRYPFDGDPTTSSRADFFVYERVPPADQNSA